jgi:5S rRNA maturation endonuclease (ribonuclease M5)
VTVPAPAARAAIRDALEHPALKCENRFCACASPPNRRGEALRHCPVPTHGDDGRDARPSLSLRVEGDRLLWRCHAGCSQEEVQRALREAGVLGGPASPPAPAPPEEVVTDYEIRDAGGALIATHRRWDSPNGKRFAWLRPDGRPGLGGLRVADLPLYGSEHLAARPGEPVILVEGEKAAVALQRAGFLAVGTVTGASTVPSDEVLRPLVGRTIYLWHDCDEAGRLHMDRIARRLQALGAHDVRRVEWQDAVEGSDAHDYVSLFGAEATRSLLEAARPWEPQPEEDRPAATRISSGGVARRSSAPADAEPLPTETAAEEDPTRIPWAWRGLVPLDSVTLLVGPPGVGKTTLAVTLLAGLTRGAVEGDLCGAPVPVLVLSAEDSFRGTIQPRLRAAGADEALVFSVRLQDCDPLFPKDLRRLRATIEKHGVRAVLIDPLAAFLTAQVNTWRDSDVRQALRQLSRVAEDTHCAVLCVQHPNKGKAEAAWEKVGGSIGFVAHARSVLVVGPDPTEPGRLALAVAKGNLGVTPPPRAFRLESVTVPGRSDGDFVERLEAPRVVWLTEVPAVTPHELLRPMAPEEAASLEEAEEFLEEMLRDGPQPADDLKKRARNLGLSERTLHRARQRLRVVYTRVGGRTCWALPEGEIVISRTP